MRSLRRRAIAGLCLAGAVIAGCRLQEGIEPKSDLLTPHIAPVPKQAAFDVRTRVDVCRTPIVVRCGDSSAVDWVRCHLGEWLKGFGVPSVCGESAGETVSGGAEAYRLEVGAEAVTIRANSLQGVRYALYTYRQTWEPKRGTLKVTGYTAPSGSVEDRPSLAFRGIHLCWFDPNDGVTVKFMEHQIRMAAYLKLNYAVVESWGVIRSEKHPYLSWEGATPTISLEEVRRLGRLARELGVTVIPQLNVFGHAAMARWVAAKHATLDFRPEYQPLFEPYGGWNWCLTNSEVRRIQKDLIDELLEAWGQPNYFHIGCDEAEPPSCSACCAGDYRKVVAAHLADIAQFLGQRGVRPLMWHDMLLRKGDRRFQGFYSKGAPDAAELLASLPRSIVICDWYYVDVAHEAYPTLDYFKKQGFDVVTCPWDRPLGIRAQAKWVVDHGMHGVLLTTWNHLAANDYANVWSVGTSAAWGAIEETERLPDHQHVTSLWRQVGWDMGLTAKDYREFGFSTNQSDRNMPARY